MWTFTHVDRAGALRPMKFVAGEREEIDAPRLHIDRYLADRLHRVGVEEHTFSLAMRASSATGWSEPVSLFAAMMLTRHVFSVMARPVFRTDDAVSIDRQIGYCETELSSQRHVAITDGCSTEVVIIWFLEPREARATPLMTKLFPSEPPLLNIRRRGVQLIRRDRLLRAASIASCDSLPAEWMLDGLP